MKKNIKNPPLSVRVSPEMKRKLSDLSLQTGLTVSDIVKSYIENKTIEITTIKELDPIVSVNLARVFNNINQISRNLNIARKHGCINLNILMDTQESLYKNERLLAGILEYLRGETHDSANNQR